MVKSFSCVRSAQDRVPKVNESTRGTCELSNSAGRSKVTKARVTQSLVSKSSTQRLEELLLRRITSCDLHSDHICTAYIL